MWKKITELYGWNLPAADLERLTPALEALHQRAGRAFDRDLSTVEPAPVFRPGAADAGKPPGRQPL